MVKPLAVLKLQRDPRSSRGKRWRVKESLVCTAPALGAMGLRFLCSLCDGIQGLPQLLQNSLLLPLQQYPLLKSM